MGIAVFPSVKDKFNTLPEEEFKKYIDSITDFDEINEVHKFIYQLADLNKSLATESIRAVQSKFWELLK